MIVCSYNGAKTLDRCLESLKRIEYPNYGKYFGGRWIDRQHARDRRETYLDQDYPAGEFRAQRGSQCRRACSGGEVLAYTDSDCMADPERPDRRCAG